MPWDAIKKIAINFAVVFIIASVFSSVAPGAAQKAFAFFEDKLGFGKPSIGYFTVTVDEKDNAQFMVKYSILGNYREVDGVIVSRSYGKTPDAKMSDRFTLAELSLEGANVAKDLADFEGKIEGIVKIKDERDEKNGEDDIGVGGVHRFTIEVFLSNGDVDSADAQILAYDDDYIEQAKGGISGCVTKGIGKDPAGLHECDVYAQKQESLSEVYGGECEVCRTVNPVLEELEVNPECKYEGVWRWKLFVRAKYNTLTGCTPEEMDGIWKKYLMEKGFADDYDCALPLIYDAGSVCKVKRQVVMTLDKLGWEDLRTRKGWEAGV